eukprot:PhF_6_TR41279/c0_g1_i1/m.62422
MSDEDALYYLERFGVTDHSVAVLNLASQELSIGDILDIAKGLAINYTLTSLDLSGTRLSVEGAAAIGTSLKHNQHLRHLALNNNTSLGFEGLSNIVDGVLSHPRIEVIELTRCNIRDEAAQSLATLLANTITVHTLDLSFNKITRSGAALIGGAMATNQSIRILRMGHNKIMQDGVTALCNGLSSNRSITSLDVSYNEISPDGGLAISAMLRKCPQIVDITCSNNLLATSCPEIVKALSGRDCARKIDLGNNRMNVHACEVFAASLKEQIGMRIACLTLEKNPIGDDGLSALVTSLRGKHIKFLDLTDCGITGKSRDCLQDMLLHCAELVTLHLDNNKLGDACIQHLCGAIAISRIEVLNLEDTGMGDVGAEALGAALAKSQCCRELDISGNNLKDQGAVAFLRGLGSLTTLESLDMSSLPILKNNDIVQGLCMVFENNLGLSEIDLNRCGVSTDWPQGIMTRAIAQKLAQSSSIIHSVSVSQKRPPKASMSTLSSTSAMVPKESSPQSHKPVKSILQTIHRPLWSTASPVSLGGEIPENDDDDEEIEHSTAPPLIPAPDSLFDSLYPSYGRDRLSNNVSLADISNPVGLTTYMAKGHLARTPYSPAQGYAECVVRNPPKARNVKARYDLTSLENNVSGLPITEEQLRRKFQELDVDGNGWLDRDEFKNLYLAFQNFGVYYDEDAVTRIVDKYSMFSDDKITFDEFCVIMLSLAAR